MFESSAKVTTKSVIAEQIYPIMTPHTTSRAMLRTLSEMRSTNPMERIAPANAAATIPPLLTVRPDPRKKIMVRATVSFAPDEMPSTNGPAIGLLKNVCRRNPETESAPPRIAAAIIRGRRISQMICP